MRSNVRDDKDNGLRRSHLATVELNLLSSFLLCTFPEIETEWKVNVYKRVCDKCLAIFLDILNYCYYYVAVYNLSV